MPRRLLSIANLIAIVVIFASSLLSFTRLYYAQHLDLLLCFALTVLQIMVFGVIYIVITKYLLPWLVPQLSYIVEQTILKKLTNKKKNTEQDIAVKTLEDNTLSSLCLSSAETEKVREMITESRNQEALHAEQERQREKAERELLEQQYQYMMHYLGAHLSAEQAATLKQNLHEFAYSESPQLQPITEQRCGDYKLRDIAHLCHAIGYHTICKHNGEQIAQFLQASFPTYCVDYSLFTLTKKLTDCDYDQLIPVVQKYEPLPRFEDSI